MKIIPQTIFSFVLNTIENKHKSFDFDDKTNYQISQLDEKDYSDLQKMCSEKGYTLSCQNTGWNDKKLSSKKFIVTKNIN